MPKFVNPFRGVVSERNWLANGRREVDEIAAKMGAADTGDASSGNQETRFI